MSFLEVFVRRPVFTTMLLTSLEFLATNPSPSDGEIREAIAGVLCRCTGYQNIVKSVQVAAERMRTTSPAAAPSGGTS